MMKNRAERGARIVVIDPRRTDTAEDIDLFLGSDRASDTALFAGFWCISRIWRPRRHYSSPAIRRASTRRWRARARSRRASDDGRGDGACGCRRRGLLCVVCATPPHGHLLLAGGEPVGPGHRQGQRDHQLPSRYGRIGKPGAGPFSLTGQPNAMGGREVGGMANQLAAHMGFMLPDIDRVQRFWMRRSSPPRRPQGGADVRGHRARRDPGAVGDGHQSGRVAAGRGRGARGDEQLELFVVSENVRCDRHGDSGAHVLLPAEAWGEKDGTVTNSERRVSRQRAFLPAAGEAKPDWWIMSEVAKRMGFGGRSPISRRPIFSASMRRCRPSRTTAGATSISAASPTSPMTPIEAMKPVTWPVRRGAMDGSGGCSAMGASSRRTEGAVRRAGVPALRMAVTPERPFRLNTGRVRDQWHTMTRSGLSPRLGQHVSEPYVEIHPGRRRDAGVEEGGYARVETAFGRCVLKVRISNGQQRGSLFAPIHWNDETASYARVGSLAAPFTDPYSGQPEMKATPASLEAVQLRQRGFVLAREAIDLPHAVVWTRVAIEQRDRLQDCGRPGREPLVRLAAAASG